MHVTLITPTPPDINAFGVRTLSSVLKRAGYKTRVIFLPGGIEHLKFDSSFIYRYPEKTLDAIAKIADGSSFVGLSFISQYFDRAEQITTHLRKTVGAPIIWGGTHPIARPDESLQHCDMVCVGEGEIPVLELAQRIKGKLDHTSIHGFWANTKDGVRKNPAGTLIEDLDTLPYVDYSLEDHYAYDWRTGEVNRLDVASMEAQFPKVEYLNGEHLITYRTMSSRGCPHRCSYCASSSMMKLRRRSVDNVIGEIKDVCERFGYIKLISFFDDTFFAAPASYFEEFRDKYKKEVNLPFHAQCSPTTISEKKMELLVDAGLFYTEMGIQTGSERIQKMYRRVVPNNKVVEAASLIDRYSDKMVQPDYHIILDNPWETQKDVLDTLKLLLDLPGKYELQISSLVFFPGTELNDRARAEGIIKDELNEVCRKPFTFPKGAYLNYLIFLSGFHAVPRSIIRLLSSGPLVRIFHSQKASPAFNVVFWATERVRLAAKGVIALFTGDFKRIANYFRLAR